MARLFLDKLDHGRKLYVEYSNEVWNASLTNAYWYAYEQGTALGLARDEFTTVAHYYAYRALQHFTTWSKVWKGADRSRIVFVLAGQHENAWLASEHISVMNDAKLNPSGIRPDAYAIAPYIGHDTKASSADPIGALIAGIPRAVSNANSVKSVATAAGIRFFAYEGGQHMTGAGVPGVQMQPRMKDFYKQYFDAMSGVFDVFAHYAHAGGWDETWGTWGAMDVIGQTDPSRRYKYDAIKEWVSAHP
jgi:hypothetical protein